MLAVLPMDTRLDAMSNTLVRTLPDAEQDRLLATTLKLQTTSRLGRYLYSRVIRLACLEHDLVVTDPNKQQRWGQQQHRRGQQQHHQLQPRVASVAAAQAQFEGSDEDDDGDGNFLDTHMVDAAMDEMNPEDLY